MTDIIKSSGLDMVASLADVLRLADTLAQARGGFIPDHFKNSAQVAAVILAGRELGVGPMAALRSFYLVNGKLGMDASFVSGRMLAHGIALEWLRDDDECASVRLSRAGMPPYVSTFSRQDAERAGLWGSATWRKYPRAMLRARAITAGARAYAADAFSGSVYTPDELRGGDDRDEQPAQRVQQPAERVEAAAPPAAIEAHGEAIAAPAAALDDVCARIVAAYDVAATDVEIAQLRTDLVAQHWPQLSRDDRARVTTAAGAAKKRVEAARRDLIAQLEAERRADTEEEDSE
jgi:predicted NUDIX family NTP pyrophosphohydrolase